MSIFQKVFSHLDESAHKTALICSGVTITYSQLVNSIKNFSKCLLTYGPLQGVKVLILLPNCPEFISAFFAVTYLGGIAVLADTKLNDELLGICEENGIKLVITDLAGEEKMKRLWSRDAANGPGCNEDNSRLLIPRDLRIFDNYSMNEIAETEFPQEFCSKPDDMAMILYTSGSTGRPKGVINTHKTLEEALKNYIGTLQISTSDRLVAVTPFFHSYSFGSCMLAGLASGSILLIHQSFQPRLVMKLITEEKATIFHGVPYMYNLMIQHFDKEQYSFKSIKYFICAGAPLTRDVAENFYSLTGKVIHQEYGSSETGTIALNLSDQLDKQIISVGHPLKNVQARLKYEDNTDLGVIQINSPGKSIGYVNDGKFDSEWYTTGDLGRIDEDGYIYIIDRMKRLINIAGLKVSPAEVEKCLQGHPEVVDVVVNGIKHQDFGEVVEALVIRRSTKLTEYDLIKFCQERLALYKVPKIIRWVESLPKSGTGKTIKGEFFK